MVQKFKSKLEGILTDQERSTEGRRTVLESLNSWFDDANDVLAEVETRTSDLTMDEQADIVRVVGSLSSSKDMVEAKSAEQASVVNQQRQLIIEQQRQTETLLRILSTVGDANTTTPSPPAPGAGCRPKGAVAGEPPAIEAAADDALSLAITACSGEIDFHTGVCSVNPCRLQQRVQALEARLAQLGAL